MKDSKKEANLIKTLNMKFLFSVLLIGFLALTAGCTTGVKEIGLTDITAPSTPSGLNASAGNAIVSLTWTANSEPDLGGYNVYRSTVSGSGFSKINSSLLTSNSYSNSGLTNGIKYYYKTTAVDTSGNESGYSSEISAKPIASIDTTPPTIPAGLTTIAGDKKTTLTWTANFESDLAGYNLYRSTTSGGGYTKINSSLITGTSYINTGLTNGTIYYYKLAAVDTSGNESGYSSIINTAPYAPANIVVKGNINLVQDILGYARFYGELENTSNIAVPYIQITLTMKDSSGAVIDTASSYLTGSTLKTSTGNTNTCLRKGEYGVFEVSTSILYSQVASYTYDIEWKTYALTEPSATLEIQGTINKATNAFGYQKYLGEIKNTSIVNATFVSIYFISKDSNGKVIDVSSSYVTGTDIASGGTKSFEVSTFVSPSNIASYYYRIDWDK